MRLVLLEFTRKRESAQKSPEKYLLESSREGEAQQTNTELFTDTEANAQNKGEK